MDQLSQHLKDLKSTSADTREAAARAISEIGSKARSAVPALLNALISEPNACPGIGTAIVSLSPRETDVPKLREALRSDNSHARFWAARAVVKLGPVAHPLIHDLILLLCDSHHPVTDSVIWALGSIGEAAIPQLIDAATGSNIELRARAVLALGRYPENIKLKLPTIMSAMDDCESDVRKAAACAVCSLAQSTKSASTAYDDTTLATLSIAVKRAATDSSFGIDVEWPKRILRWLPPDSD